MKVNKLLLEVLKDYKDWRKVSIVENLGDRLGTFEPVSKRIELRQDAGTDTFIHELIHRALYEIEILDEERVIMNYELDHLEFGAPILREHLDQICKRIESYFHKGGKCIAKAARIYIINESERR